MNTQHKIFTTANHSLDRIELRVIGVKSFEIKRHDQDELRLECSGQVEELIAKEKGTKWICQFPRDIIEGAFQYKRYTIETLVLFIPTWFTGKLKVNCAQIKVTLDDLIVGLQRVKLNTADATLNLNPVSFRLEVNAANTTARLLNTAQDVEINGVNNEMVLSLAENADCDVKVAGVNSDVRVLNARAIGYDVNLSGMSSTFVDEGTKKSKVGSLSAQRQTQNGSMLHLRVDGVAQRVELENNPVEE